MHSVHTRDDGVYAICTGVRARVRFENDYILELHMDAAHGGAAWRDSDEEGVSLY